MAKTASSHSHAAPRPSPWYRRVPWIAIVLTALVLVTALVSIDPVRDAVTGEAAVDSRLERGLGYVVLGPVSALFDAMTLFTPGQIIGFTLWMMALYAVARVVARQSRPVPIGREALAAVGAFALLLLVYVAVVIMPRPMAKLVVTRTDVIAVDFHSHTRFSHDGRVGWSASDLRDWHTDAGYNVAYVTDHASFDGVVEALALDSAMVGQTSTVLLPGIEAFYNGEHVNVLNAGYRYRGLTTADFVSVDTQALRLAALIPNAEPVLIETMPGNLAHVQPTAGPGTAGTRAIEIVDGSPRGMLQTHRDRSHIIQVADSFNLALVAGSDNHGWGRTAPGWTLLRIPDWRGYRPAALATQIEDALRQSGQRATRVVERTTAGISSTSVALTLPAVLWTTTRTLSTEERLSWVVWIWGAWAIVWLFRRRRDARTSA